jgi:hypothetical protein
MSEEEVKLENGEQTAGDARDPSGFLGEIIGAEVTVKLNSGLVYRGTYYSDFSFLFLTQIWCYYLSCPLSS